MACDKTEEEYHLTPTGWVSGTYSVWGHAQDKVSPPANRIETWVRRMVQSHSMAPEVYSEECVWKSDMPKRERDAIRDKFEKPYTLE